MKNISGAFYVLFLSIIVGSLSFSSCKKNEDPGYLPNIAFKTTLGYTFTDTTAAQATPVLMGIDASKAEPNDVLIKFTVTVSYDGGTDALVYTENLSGAQGDSYSKDIPVVTRSQTGTEKYTFTVVNRDGLINKVSLILNVP